MSKKILFFGPVPPPFHGQSIAFKKAMEVRFEEKLLIDTSSPTNNLLEKILAGGLILIRLLKLFISNSRPDVIYFTCSRTISGSMRDVALLMLASTFKIPVVNHLHGADFNIFFQRSPNFYKKILKRSYKHVTNTIILSDAMRDQFRMFPNLKLSVVNNFFEAELGLKAEEQETVDRIDFLYLSNIMATKGIFLVLEAFKILQREGVDVHLHIAGAVLGDEELGPRETEKLFKEYLTLMNGVTYYKTVTGSNKARLLNKSSALLLPSYYKSEAVPLSIIEAMASGCGIICSRHNYLPSLVSGDNGILVEPRSVESLVHAMRHYAFDREKLKFHQQNNVKFAHANFSEKEYLLNLEKILFNALGSASSENI